MPLDTSIRAYLGGAEIEIQARPITPEQPIGTHVLSDLQRFTAAMQKAHYLGLEKQFSQLVEGFVEELDAYLDDRMIAGNSLREQASQRNISAAVAKLIAQRKREEEG